MSELSSSPAKAAYEAYMVSLGQKRESLNFHKLNRVDQDRWELVANAVIKQAKKLIAKEAVIAAAKATGLDLDLSDQG